MYPKIDTDHAEYTLCSNVALSFLDVSLSVKAQVIKNIYNWSVGIFHNGFHFTILNEMELSVKEHVDAEWTVCPGEFYIGLVGSTIGSYIDLQFHLGLPDNFWTEIFPFKLQETCDRMIIQSIHGS